MHRVLLAALLAEAMWGQTAVDLRRHSKNADFSAMPSTKPMQVGASLPVACSTGELFYNTSSLAGQNVYACTSTNVWTQEGGSPGTGGGGGSVTIASGSTVVGSRPILSFSAGLGSLFTISDTGQAISIQASTDPSVMQTRAADQAGTSLLCASAGGSPSAYTCALSPSLTAYATGMSLRWKPDVAGAGGATTLNVDTLGAVPVKLADGSTDPAAGELPAGRLRQLWYDGAVFRLLETFYPEGTLGEAQPTCAAGARGRLWFVGGGSGVKDALSVCAKDASNVYAWRSLY